MQRIPDIGKQHEDKDWNVLGLTPVFNFSVMYRRVVCLTIVPGFQISTRHQPPPDTTNYQPHIEERGRSRARTHDPSISGHEDITFDDEKLYISNNL